MLFVPLKGLPKISDNFGYCYNAVGKFVINLTLFRSLPKTPDNLSNDCPKIITLGAAGVENWPVTLLFLCHISACKFMHAYFSFTGLVG